MTKLLIGMVALVSAVGGVTACGNSHTKANTPAAQTASVPVQHVADLKPIVGNDSSTVHESQPVALEPTPRFTLVLSEGKSGFKFRSRKLSDEAKAKIDEMFAGDKVDLKDAHFEIEGYTDNLGSKEVNDQMGLARANAVKQYLAEQFEIPADCLHAVSYGMENPAGDNSTPAGRAQNRRVVIKVMD